MKFFLKVAFLLGVRRLVCGTIEYEYYTNTDKFTIRNVGDAEKNSDHGELIQEVKMESPSGIFTKLKALANQHEISPWQISQWQAPASALVSKFPTLDFPSEHPLHGLNTRSIPIIESLENNFLHENFHHQPEDEQTILDEGPRLKVRSYSAMTGSDQPSVTRINARRRLSSPLHSSSRPSLLLDTKRNSSPFLSAKRRPYQYVEPNTHFSRPKTNYGTGNQPLKKGTQPTNLGLKKVQSNSFTLSQKTRPIQHGSTIQ